MMDTLILDFLKWTFIGALMLNAWFARQTLSYYQTQLKELSDQLSRVQQDYLHKSDFREFKLELRGMFEELKQDIRDLKDK